ncbi:predicted protein [Lichtheimia corymbifera JMRC:FSU:9682]|uniref:Uncharacterized protein n=1 Tax=Lichtheimia corymbifera JMRC:FSU:9682 TaxID=1263082 RepID=A0A068S7B3_9FUNG|nr:predicted protein [Lichtheimia corymbifera JMRC:FSU:9682]
MCSFCEDVFLLHRNTYHRCPANDGNALASQPQGLRYTRVLYAHDIIDDDAFGVTPEMITQWQIRAVDAVDILNQQGINQWQFDRGELGPVYISDTGPRNVAWESHQAMDKAIVATVLHVSTLPLRRGPFVVASCGVDDVNDRCRYLTVIHPTRTERIIPPGPQGHPPGYEHRRSRIHTHRAQGGRACEFSNDEATNFWQLPLAVKRYLWMNFMKDPEEHQNEDPTLWAVDQPL